MFYRVAPLDGRMGSLQLDLEDTLYGHCEAFQPDILTCI